MSILFCNFSFNPNGHYYFPNVQSTIITSGLKLKDYFIHKNGILKIQFNLKIKQIFTWKSGLGCYSLLFISEFTRVKGTNSARRSYQIFFLAELFFFWRFQIFFWRRFAILAESSTACYLDFVQS